MLLDNAITDAQSQAGAFAHGFGREKRLENPIEMFRRNAAPGVGYFHHHPLIFHQTADQEGASFRHGLARIEGQIQQDLLKLNRPREGIGQSSDLPGLREQHKDDEPLIRLLHQRLAPKMTYAAEAALDHFAAHHHRRGGFVLARNGEVVAYVGVHHGRRGDGLQLLFRPEAEEQARPMLEHCLARLRRAAYVTVRHYHSWLLPVLDQIGFVHVTSTMLMVRHVAAQVQQPVWTQSLEHATTYSTRSVVQIALPSAPHVAHHPRRESGCIKTTTKSHEGTPNH